MYVAKMTTRYPEYHGEGYFNFLMDEDEDTLETKVEEYSHDFMLVEATYVDVDDADELMAKYPSKYKLNEAVFNA